MNRTQNKVLWTLSAIWLFSAISQYTYAGEFTAFGQARLRGTITNNTDFSDANDNRRFTDGRFRVGLNFTPHSDIRVFFQPQYTKVWGAPQGTTTTSGSYTDGGTFSVHQAYINGALNDKISVQVGRMELEYGDGLVIGADDWNLVGRAFDGGRIKVAPSDLIWVDLIVAKIQATQAAGNSHALYGLYSSLDLDTPINQLDLFAFLDRNAATAPKQEWIDIGAQAKTVINDFDFRLAAILQMLNEGASTTGQSATEYFVNVEVGYRLFAETDTRIALEYSRASDEYHQGYPSSHKWLGVADVFGRRNMSQIRLGATTSPFPDWTFGLDGHLLMLTQDTAGAFSILETPYGAGNLTSKSVGIEIDVAAAYDVNDVLGFSLLGAIILPGDYVKNNMGDKAGMGIFLTANVKI